ncbi:hypothetical protein PIB30_011627 [Stylosanthes scabra]|uniref:Uncharacterized protein n=1 Tax=Stylosanthes scabra TaxID=79078 RepID=A0ABU6W475_9FABA|nr:hypothetical protein [Stylosanthes scabra]
MESRGDNVVTSPMCVDEQVREAHLQQQHLEATAQHLQDPAYNSEEQNKTEEMSENSYTVNQPATNVSKGKEKLQPNEEQTKPNNHEKVKSKKYYADAEELNNMPIKEALKRVLRNKISKFVDQQIMDMWSYREKPKQMKTWIHQGRKMLLRKPPDMQYTVEFPEEEADPKEAAPGQHREENQQEELADRLSLSLQIKRK